MIVEDTESLQTWLTTFLQPLCDAEPAALARYVLALIKKDNSEEELRRNMEDQLDVFLEKEAKPFVDKLCEVLNTKEYLKVKLSSSLETEPNELVGDNKNAKGKEDKNGNSENPNKNGRLLCHKLGRKSSPRRYRDNWDRRRTRTMRRGRNQSFSPRNSNKSRSPPPSRYRRMFNSSRSRSRSPIARRRELSISPKCRSRSLLAMNSGKESKDFSKKDSLLRNSCELDPDLTTKEPVKKTPLLQSVIVKPRGQHSPENSSQRSVALSTSGNNRCRDFDEKGLCMRGELCPYDHGKDPVVLEDILVPGMVSGEYGVAGGSMMSSTPPLVRPTIIGGYYPDGSSHESPVGWSPRAHMGFRSRHMGFDGVPARNVRGGLLRPCSMGSYLGPGGQRQLIGVIGGGTHPPGLLRMRGMPPIMPLHPGIRGIGLRGGHRGCRGGFDYSRLGGMPTLHHHHYHPQKTYTNCSLEVRKIPRDQNTIMDLNSHFIRFGKIINIQINFDGDPEAALVTFSTAAETQLAYRSTEAVLNNRFIRVFWHNKEKEYEDDTESAVTISTSNHSRIPKEHHEAQSQDQMAKKLDKVVSLENSPTNTLSENVTVPNKSLKTPQDKLQVVEPTRRNQEVLLAAQVTLKNMQEQRKAEMLKMSNDLRRRQQTMMEEQIDQQKRLITKLESGSLSGKEKQETLNVIKMLQDKVTKLQKDLDESTSKNSAHPRKFN